MPRNTKKKPQKRQKKNKRLKGTFFICTFGKSAAKTSGKILFRKKYSKNK